MGFLKKQAEKSVEKKRIALDEAISGEEVVLEFTVLLAPYFRLGFFGAGNG